MASASEARDARSAFRGRLKKPTRNGYSSSAAKPIRTENGRKALQFAGTVFLELSAADLAKALQSGDLWEVDCGEQNH